MATHHLRRDQHWVGLAVPPSRFRSCRAGEVPSKPRRMQLPTAEAQQDRALLRAHSFVPTKTGSATSGSTSASANKGMRVAKRLGRGVHPPSQVGARGRPWPTSDLAAAVQPSTSGCFKGVCPANSAT